MFKNENFEINELSPEYLALHPVASTKQPSLVEEHFEPVLEDSEQSLSNSDASGESDFEDEPSRDKHKKARAPKLYEVKDEKHAEAFWNSVSLAKEERLTMEERIAAMGDNKQGSGILNEVKLGPGGSREISFKPRSSAKYMEDDDDEGPRKKNRSAELSGPKANKSGSRGGMRHGSSRGGNNRGRGRGRGRRGRR
ncbi:hypothetical protein SDJN03_09343, partial [Cucurbita argyrosperma subsp. sororia]